jgi:Zn-finger nucleic acid-binding protein
MSKACPACFSRIFSQAKYCDRCGTEVHLPACILSDENPRVRTCPRCPYFPELTARLIGDVVLDECSVCYGVWLDRATVKRVIENRHQSSLDYVSGYGYPERNTISGPPRDENQFYIRCPDCSQMMSRTNFARRSGIILDICRGHGTWFDQGALPRLIEFVSQGGLEQAAYKEAAVHRTQSQREANQTTLSGQIITAEAPLSATASGPASVLTAFIKFFGAVGDMLSQLFKR